MGVAGPQAPIPDCKLCLDECEQVSVDLILMRHRATERLSQSSKRVGPMRGLSPGVSD